MMELKQLRSFGSEPGEAVGQLLQEGRLKHILRDAIQDYARNVAFFKAKLDERMKIRIQSSECEILGLNQGDYVVVKDRGRETMSSTCRRCGSYELKIRDVVTNFRGDAVSVIWICPNCGVVWREST